MRQKSINERPKVIIGAVLIIAVLIFFVFELDIEDLMNFNSGNEEDLELETTIAYADQNTRSLKWDGYIITKHFGIFRKGTVNNQTVNMGTYPLQNIAPGRTYISVTFTDDYYRELNAGIYVFTVEFITSDGATLYAETSEYFSDAV